MALQLDRTERALRFFFGGRGGSFWRKREKKGRPVGKLHCSFRNCSQEQSTFREKEKKKRPGDYTRRNWEGSYRVAAGLLWAQQSCVCLTSNTHNH